MSFIRGMGVGGALVGVTVLLMAAAAPKPATLDVQRINIRERDGTLRMVIASRDAFPGAFDMGKEIARPDRRDFAGMLFLNDEGTENGGFIWKGQRGRDGSVDAGASLSLDRYRNDQTLQLLQTDEGGTDTSALILSDRPAQPFDWGKIGKAGAMKDGPARDKLYAEAGVGGATRLFVGRARNRNAVVRLQDAQGRARLQLRVAPDGMAAIEFLDAAGKVVRTIGAEAGAER